jgi:diguanylate cyclase (GGDEF)-like protein/PAS domain S-box-containing protein
MDHDDAFYKNVLDNLYDAIYFVDDGGLISYWNRGAERLTGYAEAEVLGINCQRIFKHVDDQGIPYCDEMCPIPQTVSDGRIREVDLFFRHRDGHLVPVSMRIAPAKETDGQAIVAVEIVSNDSPRQTMRQQLAQLQQLALCDPLTGLVNRRYIDINLPARLDELKRYGWQFGVLFIDIDHFKKINDTYGHQTGDQVLKMVANTLLNSIRSFDILGRWGGEEFVVLLINVNEETLTAITNRFRLLVEQSSLDNGTDRIGATISIGATLARTTDTVDGLLDRADKLMYQSKVKGRNCVSLDCSTSPQRTVPATTG